MLIDRLSFLLSATAVKVGLGAFILLAVVYTLLLLVAVRARGRAYGKAVR